MLIVAKLALRHRRSHISESARADWLEQRARVLPEAGFLAPSAAGDLSNLDRQVRQLTKLETEGGFAPFLSSYLFDFRAANRPAGRTPITEFRLGLDEHQRRAVEMIMSVPDVGLVQGPPGTGKTTVICEATWQARQAGKRVLIASQANLAVDNVLDRLPRDPAIRAIRLMTGQVREIEASPYNRAKALGTYYGSVAQACRERNLEIWRRADAEHAELERFVAKGDLLSRDLAA